MGMHLPTEARAVIAVVLVIAAVVLACGWLLVDELRWRRADGGSRQGLALALWHEQWAARARQAKQI